MKSLFILTFILVSMSAGSTNIENYTSNIPKPEIISEAERTIPEEYRFLIVTECMKYKIPLEIFVKHIYRESKFNPNAIHYNYKKDPTTGKKYIASIDRGIGQQNSLYHKEAVKLDNNGKEFDSMNPYEAIPVIAHHLYRMHKITNNWVITIAGYNCGLYRAMSGKPLPEITQRHLAYVFGDNYGKNIKIEKA